jgi:hypothetical protein
MGFDFGKAAGAIGTGGLSIGGFQNMGSLFGDDSKARAMKLLLEQMQRAQALANTKAEGYGLQGLHGMQSDFDAAIKNVAGTAAASKMAALGAGQRANAGAAQSLSGRGLYNTSALEGARAMNQGAVGQALSSIDQGVAGSLGQLRAQRGQALNQGYTGLGGLAERYGQAQQGPLGMAYQSVASAPTQMQQMMQLLQGVGSVAPMFMTGGAGMNPAMLQRLLAGLQQGGGGDAGHSNPFGI